LSEGGDSRPTTHERRCAKIAPDGGENGAKQTQKTAEERTGKGTAKETAGKTGGGQRKNDGATGMGQNRNGRNAGGVSPVSSYRIPGSVLDYEIRRSPIS